MTPAMTNAIATSNRVADQLTAQLAETKAFPASVSVAAEGIEPLAWLDAQTCETKLVWNERDSTELTVCLGEAALVVAEPLEPPADVVDRCRALMQGNEQLRCFGGLSFDGKDDWRNFGAGRFVLPRFVLQAGRLQLNVMDADDMAAAKNAIQQLTFDVAELSVRLPQPVETRHSPTQDGWQSNVDEALTLIRSEVLEKIVLARKTRLRFEETINPIGLTARIADATHDCYVFCLQFGQGQAFVGATPERLFKQSGDQLWCDVVAGTRPRGVTSDEDQRLAYELLTSEKDQLEHDIVRKSIRQKLHKYVDELNVDTHASVLRLAQKQHLCSSVDGRLKAGVDEGALLTRLHPTPAVGGYPTENALPEIARLEPFSRGWYAAPIGWIGARDGEFVVGIRSALVEGNQLSLYSGAGIVKGSDPDQEWDEVENKIRDFVDILGK